MSKKFGERIKQRRLELGLSQDELAKKMGYTSRSTINKIEKGVNEVPFKKVLEFADVLDTSVVFLLSGDKELARASGPIEYVKPFEYVTKTEEKLINAYRNADDLTKQMVLRLLNIEPENKEGSNIA